MEESSDSSVTRDGISNRNDLWAQFWRIGSERKKADIIVLSLILACGILQCFLVQRSPDFLDDDAFYADAGRSLVEHGFYGINGYAETNQPPGLPAILGILSAIEGSSSRVLFLCAISAFGVLGFLVGYELLRRQVIRIVAGAICLLLMTSPPYFKLATQWVSPCYPYFFATMSALLVARKFESARNLRSRIGWGALLTALIVASLMFGSVAIALFGAIVASSCALLIRDRALGVSCIRAYLLVLIVGIGAQGIWARSHGTIEASSGIAATEWPVPGFPQSYLSQLKVKSGNYPELGTATLRDIPIRILRNASEHASLLSQMLLRRPLFVTSISITVLGPLILIVWGLCSSIRRTGGELQDWYFASYEVIYFLWPWNQEARFFLPVAPLACLYGWRGLESLAGFAMSRPRLLGILWAPIGTALAAATWLWMRGSGMFSHLAHAGSQDEVSLVGWSLSVGLATWMICAGQGWLRPGFAFLRLFGGNDSALPRGLPGLLKIGCTLAVTAGLAVGLAIQLELGLANLDLNSSVNQLTPDAEAGDWIRANTDPNAVVMARLVPTIYHHSHRKVVWFPPSSDPRLLREGILKHKVDFLVVVRRGNNYYLPPDNDSIAPLLAESPESFQLVYESPHFSIFKVMIPNPR
jgi:hypothetical protein